MCIEFVVDIVWIKTGLASTRCHVRSMILEVAGT